MSLWLNTSGHVAVNEDGDPIWCEECPCDICAATTASAIAEFLEGRNAKLTITSDDFFSGCTAGDCALLIGEFTLPFETRAANIVNWSDSFSGLFACGLLVSLRISARAVVTGPTSAVLSARAFGLTGTGGIRVDCGWEEVVAFSDCEDLVTSPHGLPAQNTDTGGGPNCRTSFGTGLGGTILEFP